MSDRGRGLPEFPCEDAERYERVLGSKEAPDRFVDRFRHAWPVYTIFGVLLCLWLAALLVTGLSASGEGAFLAVLFLPLIPLAIAFRVWLWSHFFSRRRKGD